jgi:hypothetical protein
MRIVFMKVGERKKRGPPTEATKAKRHEKKRLAERQQNRDGFINLFGKATATTTNSTSIPSSSYENDGIDGRSSTTSASIPSSSYENARQDAPPQPDIIANLDDVDKEENFPAQGIMVQYLEAVQKRVNMEVQNKNKNELLSILKDNDWWLRAVHARKVCKILNLEHAESSYYRDVYVWLPDCRWGMIAMPPCPSCGSKEDVAAHGWRDNVYGLATFFILP